VNSPEEPTGLHVRTCSKHGTIGSRRTVQKREEIIIAKNRNTFAKRARETDKRRKAEEKRASRREKNEQSTRDKLEGVKAPEEEAPTDESLPTG